MAPEFNYKYDYKIRGGYARRFHYYYVPTVNNIKMMNLKIALVFAFSAIIASQKDIIIPVPALVSKNFSAASPLTTDSVSMVLFYAPWSVKKS